MRIRYAVTFAAALILVVVLAGIGIGQQARNPDADWPMYNRDYAGTRYSPLTQITPANVANLKQVWSYRLRQAGKQLAAASPSEIFQEITPIVVNGGL